MLDFMFFCGKISLKDEMEPKCQVDRLIYQVYFMFQLNCFYRQVRLVTQQAS